MLVEKIISGGQTGVDRAALDVALEQGVTCGGWCPCGRKAEDGAIDKKYPLRETPSSQYAERTERNVKESDGTLILTTGPLTGGTALTKSFAERHQRPCYVVDLVDDDGHEDISIWINENMIKILNVAGPRGSQRPEIYSLAASFLRQLLAET